jgi:uncharacterized protein (TIGR00255 family)
MTAYGRSEHQAEGRSYTVEVRSLNHRYLDILLRTPKNLQAMDARLRAVISSRVRRGRVEVSVQMVQNSGQSATTWELNLPVAESYHKVLQDLAEHFDLNDDVKLETLAHVTDVIVAKPAELDLDRIAVEAEEALGLALDSLEQMRVREGEAIRDDLEKRLGLLERYLSQVQEITPALVEAYRERLRANIQSMVEGISVDEGRLAQEVAYYADRSDVTEETVRIRSHLAQFREYLVLDDSLGRRLDFLIQEINREVNTLSNKASDSEISKIVVEMKAEMEKLREQVQNVE